MTRAEDGVPSFALLERAADSLAMTTSRKGESLKVQILRGTELNFPVEYESTERKPRYGWLPSWWQGVTVVVMAAVSVNYLWRTPVLNGFAIVFPLMFLAALESTFSSSARAERATARKGCTTGPTTWPGRPVSDTPG